MRPAQGERWAQMLSPGALAEGCNVAAKLSCLRVQLTLPTIMAARVGVFDPEVIYTFYFLSL